MIRVHAMKMNRCSHQNRRRCALSFEPELRGLGELISSTLMTCSVASVLLWKAIIEFAFVVIWKILGAYETAVWIIKCDHIIRG